MEEGPKQDSLARALKWLAVAVGGLAVVVLGLLAMYAFAWIRSASMIRGSGPQASSFSSSRSSTARSDGGSSFDLLTPERKVELAVAILLTKHQKTNGRNKSVVVEILKQTPGTALPYRVGDDVDDLSRFQTQDGTDYGEGEVVFYKDPSFNAMESMTYRNGRVSALGEMRLETLRALAAGKPVNPAPSSLAESRPLSFRTALPGTVRDEIDLERSTNGEGVTRFFAISKMAALRIPEWKPEDGEPPLTAAKAVQLATSAAQSESPGHPSCVARGIRIHLVSCDEPIGNRWYYVVDCVPAGNGVLSMSRSVPVVVLMDGSIVTGTIQNR